MVAALALSLLAAMAAPGRLGGRSGGTVVGVIAEEW